jgi:hypothetical protein
MKKMVINLLCGGFFMLLVAAGFAGCTSAAQSRADELFPRHEQARIMYGSGVVELMTLDGEDASSIADVMSGTPPGLTPGKHSLEFYFGSWGTVATPGATTTSTVRSGNVSVTTSRTQTNTSISYERTSDLLTLESEFKPGRAYALINGNDGNLIIYEVGYSDWYWEWRVDTKKPSETLVTIEDEHWRAADGIWPFVLLIDGEPSLFFTSGQEYEIVLTPGPHTFAVIDKVDALNEAISVSYEIDIPAGEAGLEVQGEGKRFTIVEASAEALAAAKKAEDEAKAKTVDNTEAAMRLAFPIADASRRPGPGESILEMKVDVVFGLGLTFPFALDGKPIANLQNDETIRVIIPNGRHAISVQNDRTAETFIANSNLISATWEQGLLLVSLNVEVKPLN